MSGFEVEVADMDLLKQVFDRQQGHMNAIRDYVSNHCTTPGGFGIVLQPLAPHYQSAYSDGVTGLGNGATVAEACSTKIGETKTSLVETDRKQYERYAQQQADMGHDVPPYTPPPGGGTLPPASSGYQPEGEEGEYPSLDAPYTWLAEKGYDAADTAQRLGHTPEHAAPGGDGGTDGGSTDSDGDSGPQHRADADHPASGSGSSDSSSGSGDSGSSDSSSSSSGSGDADSSSSSSGSGDSGGSEDGPRHRAGEHEAPDEPNVIGKATEIYNAPGDYYETGKDAAETIQTSEDLNDEINGPVNDDQTDWATSGSSF